MGEARVQRGFRPAFGRRRTMICYRVINGPLGMKEVWRDVNGLQMRCQEGIEVVEGWSDSQIALLPFYHRPIVCDDQRLIERALNTDQGSRPYLSSQQPIRIDPAQQRLIDDARRRQAVADAVTYGRRYTGCRVRD